MASLDCKLDCKILTEETDVKALAGEWRALYEKIGGSIFTDYDWFGIWWNTVGHNNGRKLHIVTGRIDGKLVALLPLVVIRRKGFRVLQAIGAEAFFYCDMLSEHSEYAQAVWQAARKSPYYDFAHLRDAAQDSVCERALHRFATLHDRDQGYRLELEPKMAAEWGQALFSGGSKKSLPPHLRKLDLNRRLRRLEEKGPLRYEMCRHAPVPLDIIEGLVAEKTAWGLKHQAQGMFDQPDILQFYKQIAEQEAQKGSLVLAWLKSGDQVIAYHIMFTRARKVYSYAMATHDDWLAYSPGHLAHIYAISWAIENGFGEFDHMNGDFAYKRVFSNLTREYREYSFSASCKGMIGERLFFTKRTFRQYLRDFKIRRTQKTAPAQGETAR